VEFGVEATDVIRDSRKWEGRAVIRLTVTSAAGTDSDSVILRVAPLLTQHHLQQTRQVMVTKLRGNGPGERKQRTFVQRTFVKNLAAEVRRAGVTKPLITFDEAQRPVGAGLRRTGLRGSVRGQRWI
jgi:protein-arginine deiminase